MKRLLTFSLLIAIILLVASFWFRGELAHTPETRAQQTKAQPLPKRPSPTEAPSATRRPVENQPPTVTLQSIKYEPDYVAMAHSQENPPFEFRGGQITNGKVFDRDGNVLMESGKELEIFGVSVSPDKKQVLVEGYNAINFVLSPTTQGKTQLPIRPPGSNRLAFGSWHWVNDHSLIGESGIAKVEKDGRPWRRDDNVAQSKLYVYDLITKELTEATLPIEIDAQLFGIVEASPDGYINLANNAPKDNKPRELGWFKVGPP
jgi:hypothetical protein